DQGLAGLFSECCYNLAMQANTFDLMDSGIQLNGHDLTNGGHRMPRRMRQAGLRDRARVIFSRQESRGLTNVQLAEICEVDPATVAGWRTWAGVGRGTGTGSAPPSAQLDRVDRYLDSLESDQANAE